ncbi:response regulator transcription factor [Plantibacter sp. YIM 135249]|uniref:response regulator transcription factor n=1 Tax=Plantibacter sp. YIM 135249 TaxID=3423918 RepID=UPI003D33F828
MNGPAEQAPRGGRTIRILVADDQATVRDGLVTILELTPGIDVVGAAANGAEALSLATATRPDVVLMDLGMPVVDGVGATTAILAALPATRILVLTTYVDDVSIRRALDAGAAGYLTKSAGRADIVAAIRSTAQGQNTFAPEVTKRMLGGLHGTSGAEPGSGIPSPSPSPSTSGSGSNGMPDQGAATHGDAQHEIERLLTDPRFGSLTEQERRVLALVLDRRRNPEIAAQLYVSVSTVKTHINNLFAKLGVRSRDEAIALVRSH